MTPEEFKEFVKKDKKNREKDMDDFLNNKGDYKQSKKDDKNKTDDDKNTLFIKLNPLYPLKWAWGQWNKLQDLVFATPARWVENKVSGLFRKGQVSKYKAKRVISNIIVGWFGGINRTSAQLKAKLSFTGDKNEATENAVELIDKLRSLVSGDIESLRRVDQALDPDFYFQAGQEPVTYDELNAEEKELYRTIRGIYDRIHDWNYDLELIDEETYQKHYGTYVGREYDMFNALPPELQEALEKGNSTLVHAKTRELYGERIAETMGPMMLNIYKARKDVNEWMAEHKLQDPAFTVAKRLMQTKVNAAIIEYTNHIANNSPELVSNTEKPGFTRLRGGGKFGKSKIWGPLTNKWVANHIYEDFTMYQFHHSFLDAIYDACKWYDRTQLRQFLKKYHTVFSPTVQLGNYTANFQFAFANGIDPITFMWNRIKARKIYRNKGEEYNKLLKAGLLSSDVLTGDLTPLSSQVKEAQEFMKNDNESRARRAATWVKRGFATNDKVWTKTYQSNDDVAKIAAYISHIESGFSEEKALELVYEGFQNYATVGKNWDLVSKMPYYGNAYAKFVADFTRILKNQVTRRPLNLVAFYGGWKMLTLAASAWSGEDETQRKIREKRSFIPKIPLGWMGKEDLPLVIQTPYGEINGARYFSPLYIYDTGDLSSSDLLWKFSPLKLERVKGYEAGTSSWRVASGDVLLGPWIESIVLDRDFRNKSIQDPEATRYTESGVTPYERIWNSTIYIARSQVPGFKIGHDLYLSTETGKDFYGRNKSELDVFISSFIKVEQIKGTRYEEIAIKEAKTIKFKKEDNDRKIQGIQRTTRKAIAKAKEEYEEGKITKAQYDRRRKEAMSKYEYRHAEAMEERAKIVDEFKEWMELLHDLKTGKGEQSSGAKKV
jgi:hypothetical protein